MPRVLRGVEHRSMSTTALGYQVSVPIGIAPTAMHKMAHEDGEIATAKGLKHYIITGFKCLHSSILFKHILLFYSCL